MLMLKMGESNIKRGEKWVKEKAKAVFENRTADVQFYNSQVSIVNDIKEYEDSIKGKEVIKSKGKK